jgi:4-amino-4-deoxy-L-arabinose transferase-like glycosyltransferase
MKSFIARPGSFKSLLWGIFLLALLLRLVYIFVVPHEPEPPMDDRHYYALTAQQILAGNGILQNRAYAYQPPVFPVLEAGVFALFGVNNTTAVEIVLAFFGALQCVFLALWAKELATERVGLLAGLWAAAYPQFIRYPQTRYSEAFYMCLIALGLWALTRALRNRSAWLVAVAGAVFGLSALTREVSLFFIPVIACWFWTGRRNLPEGLPRYLATFVLGMALVITPWTIRNWLVLRTFAPISTNGGINFYIGNSPRAEGRYNREVPFDWFVVPGVEWNDGAAEVEANKRGFAEGLKYVKEYPGRALKRWGNNAYYLWEPPSLTKAKSGKELVLRLGWLIFYLAMFGFGVYGLYRLGGRWRSVSLGLFGLLFLSFPYFITYADTRYRLPAESVFIFYTAVGLDFLLRRYYRQADAPVDERPLS